MAVVELHLQEGSFQASAMAEGEPHPPPNSCWVLAARVEEDLHPLP